MTRRVRIKKEVRPYGGRLVEVLGRHTYPNGRQVVQIKPPLDVRVGFMSPREYELHEIEELPEKDDE